MALDLLKMLESRWNRGMGAFDKRAIRRQYRYVKQEWGGALYIHILYTYICVYRYVINKQGGEQTQSFPTIRLESPRKLLALLLMVPVTKIVQERINFPKYSETACERWRIWELKWKLWAERELVNVMICYPVTVEDIGSWQKWQQTTVEQSALTAASKLTAKISRMTIRTVMIATTIVTVAILMLGETQEGPWNIVGHRSGINSIA